jgi:predicted MFS family arabinose efflux permease
MAACRADRNGRARHRGRMAESRPILGRRVAFAATAFAFALAMMGTTLPTPLYPLYRERFGFSELMITVIFATYAAGVIAALLLFGRLSDAIGRRPVLLAGLALSAVSAAVFLVADGLALLIAGRIISGSSAGVFTGTATATLVDLAAPERHARATLAATVANMGGLGCGALLAGVLSEWAGSPLRLTFCVDLALLVPAALGIQTMPEPVVPRSGLRLRPQGLRLPAEMRATFAQAAVAAFAGAAVLGLFTAVSPAFLGQTLGVTNRAAVGLVVFVVFAASTVGQASLQFVRERLALPAGCMVLIAGMGFLALALWLSSLTLLVLGAVVAGFGQGLSFRAGLAELNARSPAERRAAVASSFFVVMYLALALPVIGEGVLTQLVGLRAAGLTFAAVVAALAAVALLLLWRGSQHEERVRLPLAHGHKPSTA